MRSCSLQLACGMLPLGSERALRTLPDPSGTALLRSPLECGPKLWRQTKNCRALQVVVSATPSSGRGLYAAAPIEQGAPVLSVPAQLVLTAERAAAESELLRALVAQHELPAWSVLALWLVEARAAGPGGRWARYVGVLPQGGTGCVLEWSAEQVRSNKRVE